MFITPNKLKHHIVICVFFCMCSSLHAQQRQEDFDVSSARQKGIPPMQHYMWSKDLEFSKPREIVQHSNGLMYVMCREGIVEFDGSRWEVIYRDKKSKLISFSISEEGLIYLISATDFGMLQRDGSGRYHFTSFRPELDPSEKSLGLGKKCYTTKNKVYFVYSKFIFELRDHKVLTHKLKHFLHDPFMIEQTLYFRDNSGKIIKFDDGIYETIEGSGVFKSVNLSGATIGGNLVVANKTGQFYSYNNKQFTQTFKLNDRFNFTRQVFLPIDIDKIAVGTIDNGVLIYTTSGELLAVIDKDRGLPSQDIIDLYIDNNKNLWVAHSKGISKIELFSPFSFYNEKNTPDIIFTIKEHNQKLYCVSRNSAFELQTDEMNIIENQKFDNIFSSNVATKISFYKDLLLIATTDGLYAVKDHKTYLLIDSLSYYAKGSKVNEDILYVSGEEDILVYKDLGASKPLSKRFIKIKKITLTHYEVSRNLFVECDNGDLLINANFKNIERIQIKTFFPFEYTQETIESPLKDYSHISLTTLKGEPVVLMGGLVFKFNVKQGKFIEHSINKQIRKINFKPYLVYQKDSLSDIIISGGTKGKMALVRKTDNGDYHILKNIFKRYPAFQTWYFFLDSKGIFWMGTAKGLVRFDPKRVRDPKPLPKVLIRDFGIANKDSLIFKGTIPNNDVIKLSYSDNSIKLKYAFLDFSDTEANRFKYVLEGYDDKWSKWTYKTEKEYNNLSEGTYQFKVKAKNAYQQESVVTSFTFIVLPPWYRTWWAFVLYIFVFTTIVWVIVRWRSSKLEKEKEILEATVKERTQEIIEKSKQLEKQAAKLKEMDKVKSRFFANISHEFRTPITLIKGPINDLINSKTKGVDHKKIMMVDRNADRLLQLVNQLLDLSKLDAGSLKLEPRECDLNHFLRSLGSAFNSFAEQRNISYDISISQNTLVTSFDKDKLEKIVSNLLSNAFKYTPDYGEVKFYSVIQNNQVKIEISDTGVGIAQEKLPQIFDRFYQVDASTTRDQEGTGIGLALVKELVVLHHGKIQVNSSYGQGTTFSIAIPLPYIKESIENPDPGFKERPTTKCTEKDNNLKGDDFLLSNKGTPIILIVEDNNDMRRYIIDYLKDKFQILEAIDGEMGLKIAQKEIPDLIISDVMMPKMDGTQMCKQLKNDEKTSHIPIVMLTAKADQQDKLSGLNIGIDDYLVKPFDNKELKARINNLIAQRNTLRERYSQQITLEPKRVLITPKEQVFLEKVIESIEQNLSNSAYGVPEMQKHLSMSKTQLHRKIKAITDQAPGEFLRNYRLKTSAQLLCQQSDNISQVAYTVGFNSVSYFTKCFKSLYGMPPTEFVKEQAKKG